MRHVLLPALLLAVAVVGCGKKDEAPTETAAAPPSAAATPAPTPAAAPQAPPPAAPAAAPPAAPVEVGANLAPPQSSGAKPATPAQAAKATADLPAQYKTADLANGQRQAALCRSCHTWTDGGPNLVGPNLHGVFGRKAGSKSGYTYSDALKAAPFSWDEAKLDAWLLDPRAFVPGTKMTFSGVKDAKDRTDLIAFLKVQTSL